MVLHLLFFIVRTFHASRSSSAFSVPHFYRLVLSDRPTRLSNGTLK